MNTHAEVVDVLTAVCGTSGDKLGPDVPLESVGLDSLGLLEVALAMQKDLDVAVDDGEVARARTVGDLVRIVDEARRKVA